MGRYHRVIAALSLAAAGVLLAVTAWALTVELGWDANTETDLAGYRVYASTHYAPQFGGPFSRYTDARNTTTITFTNLSASRTYWVAVTAYNTSNQESSFSNIVDFNRVKICTGVKCAGPAMITVKATTGFKNASTAKVLTGSGWQRIDARRR